MQIQNRGVQGTLIACVDGLRGFPDDINTVYPNAKVVAADLKAIYGADTLEIAEADLEHFDKVWDNKYPHVVKSWRSNWEGLTVFFEYPKDIRKAIYTTNAIESLNSLIRTAVNKRKVFPSD